MLEIFFLNLHCGCHNSHLLFDGIFHGSHWGSHGGQRPSGCRHDDSAKHSTATTGIVGQSHFSEDSSSDKAVFGSTYLILYWWRVELMVNLWPRWWPSLARRISCTDQPRCYLSPRPYFWPSHSFGCRRFSIFGSSYNDILAIDDINGIFTLLAHTNLWRTIVLYFQVLVL